MEGVFEMDEDLTAASVDDGVGGRCAVEKCPMSRIREIYRDAKKKAGAGVIPMTPRVIIRDF